MFRSVLCPVDPAERGPEAPALTNAKRMVEASGGKLTLLAVIPDTPGMAAEYLPADFRETQWKDAEATLKDLAQSLGLPAGTVATKVRYGRPYHEILEEAVEAKSDLIVMASHRPSLSTYLIGSNAAHVVRHAKCSVMVLRPEAA
ncbi:universal stress protein [Phreatobacter aquaticus]|uniref:Universal stress protein n=1 Tax=Phreatobacter aquaticus TaxID=2570229 RepID=A0A4D7QK82_9HYPH|nr:universal stress protein [Phreatobacter aquaticus]QCK88100.1 universal stress protein [Phreatobacter aquaticus]